MSAHGRSEALMLERACAEGSRVSGFSSRRVFMLRSAVAGCATLVAPVLVCAAVAGCGGASSGRGLFDDRRGTHQLDSGAHYYDVYETADGRWISLGALEPLIERERGKVDRRGIVGSRFKNRDSRHMRVRPLDRCPVCRRTSTPSIRTSKA